MTKYNKKISGAVSETNDLESSIRRLKNFTAAREIDRRHWSRENFGNPDGLIFKISRVIIPILSLFLFCTMFIYCSIRDAQSVLKLAYTADIGNLEFIFAFVAIMCIALFAGNILLLFKKYFAGSIVSGAATLCITVHTLSQLGIAMPENNGSNTSFSLVFGIFCAVYFILFLLCVYILYCLIKSKRTVNRIVKEILEKISRSSNDMLSDKDYCEKIEEYIEKEKSKLADSRKEGGSLLTFADDLDK